jgi:NADPH2 dehydrogenase
VHGLPGLLEPLKIRDYTFRNRIVLAPMQTGKANFEGMVTNRLINFYARRSAYTGLLIVEHSFVEANGKIGPKQLAIHDDSTIIGLRKLAEALHSVGALAVIQISHAGAVTSSRVIGTEPVGPSPRKKSRMLEIEEIIGLAEAFALASERAVKAGFDGVELHGAHGYLLNQFWSPLFNNREDEFGGSLENRMRFPLLTVEKVRRSLGDRLLLYRLGSDDLAPKGNHAEDSAVFAQRLENSGVDLIDVSGGMCGSEPKQLRQIKGYFIPQAEVIKKFVKVPVIGVGGITQPEHADALVREGKVDFVAVGRAFWGDADWAKKAVEKLKNVLS